MLYLSDSEGTAFLFAAICRIIGLYYRCGKATQSTDICRDREMEGKRNVQRNAQKEQRKLYRYGKAVVAIQSAGRACDKVCFTVFGNETIRTDAWAPFMQSVVVFGRCHLMEAGPEASQRLKLLAMKYYPSEQLVDEEIAQSGKAVQVFEIEIEHMSGKEVQER